MQAFAEALHHEVRTQLWGYDLDEDLDAQDLLKVKYQVRTAELRADCDESSARN